MFLLENYSDVPEYVQDYLSSLANISGKSENTVAAYHTDLKAFLRYTLLTKGLVDPAIIFNDIPAENASLELIKTVSAHDISSFGDFRINNGAPVSTATKYRRISSVKHFLTYLYKNGVISDNIAFDVSLPTRQTRAGACLSASECTKLLNACDGAFKERDFAIIMLFLSTGLRTSELVSLNLSDIKDSVLHIRGQNNRFVYLSEECKEAINDYLAVRDNYNLIGDDRGCLFVSQKHQRLTVRAVELILKRKLESVGIDKSRLSPQVLRNTAASIMFQNGIDTMVICDILGVTSLNPQLFRKPEDSIALMAEATRSLPPLFTPN